jgi:hypothetical protein
MGRSAPKNHDPAEAANKKVMAMREERIVRKEAAATLDLGLDLKEHPAESAAELLRDEFDKKAFGDAPKTTTRTIYGPDPIVANCPEFHERLERFGLEAVAAAFADLIMQKGEFAAPDAVMSRGIRQSIAKFGKEATAKAFRDRIMQIPSRVVEIELDGELDPLLTNPMREAVAKYGSPGMSNKFLSERCMAVLGKRGYEIVKDERGDPVKIGTLIMGEIPRDWAERRLRHFAEESSSLIAEQEDAYYEAAAREIRSEGGKAAGVTALAPGDMLVANPGTNDLYTGEARETGIKLTR